MERVTRVRGAYRDDNDDPVPGSEIPLMAAAIRPGSTFANRDRGRNGQNVAYTAYFWPRADLRDGDKLIVRGDLCDIVVLDWISPYTGRHGHEVLCSTGEG